MAEPWKPHAGQRLAIKYLVEHAAAGLFADPGVGKTSSVYAAFSFLKKRKVAERMLVIAPLRPAQLVWPAERDKWKDFAHLRVELLHGPGKAQALARDADVYVINPEGLDWLLGAVRTKGVSGKVAVTTDLKGFKALRFDTLVIDECFPAGTQILTPDGDRSIEHLEVGDLVSTDIGDKLVVAKSKRNVNRLVRLLLNDGEIIVCTPNHPIFTDTGWLAAEHCLNRRLYSYDEMRDLRKTFPNSDLSDDTKIRISRICLGLFKFMRKAKASWADFRKDSEEDFRKSQNKRCDVQIRELPRGSWLWSDEARDTFAESVAGNFFVKLYRMCGAGGGLSFEIRGGFREPRNKDSDRGRWEITPQRRTCKARSEERGETGRTRVDCVTHYEPNGGQDVWNIQVEDAERYFASGYLVHNCTKFKNVSSSRFKAMKTVLHTFSRRWALTGTPVPNGLIDLFGQCYMLDLGRTFGPYVTHFRREYFLPSYDGFSWVLQKGAESRIYERLKPLALRLAAEDYVDMPDVVDNIIKFDLPPNVRKIYDELEDDLISRIEDRTVVASTAAAASTKCRQVASGGLYSSDTVGTSLNKKVSKAAGREWFDLHDLKTDLLEDLVEELQGSPILVGYEFKHDLERLRRRFGRDVPHIGGGTSFKNALFLQDAWNRGDLPILLGHPAAIGHGVNLQKAGSHVCWYSLPNWNLELYDQFIRRVRRQGSKHSRVFVHHLVARDTLDEVQYWTLKNKAKGQTALFEALRTMKGRR